MPSRAYSLYAINLYDSIRLKSIRSVLSGKVIDTSPHELQLHYGENQYLFIYRFGCLVFFNMDENRVREEMDKLKRALGPSVLEPTSENHEVKLGGTNLVEFEFVQVKRLSLDYLRLIAVTIGQSASLEYFELMAERMLQDTSSFMNNLAKSGFVPLLKVKRLLKIIGSTAGTRQHIISNVSILDPPEETWQSAELEHLFRELQQNFDIDTRFRVLDRKLSLVQDNIEVLANLTTHRRTTLLETLIVGLIVLEIVFALSGISK